MRKIIVIFILSLNLFGYNELEFDSIDAKFTQIIKSQNQTINYSGLVVIDSKFGAFWQYQTPTTKLIYFRENRVTIIEPELEQAIITSLKNSPDITQILKNAKKLTDDKFQAQYDDIIYNITMQNNSPKLISYEDKLGNQIAIEFTQIIKNKPIDKGLLTPKIPANYDIISN